MKLLINEEELLPFNKNSVCLTNQRIVLKEKQLGGTAYTGIFLEDLASVEVKYRSFGFLLALALVSLLAGLGIEQMHYWPHGTGLALVFIAIWWFTRKHIVRLSSTAGTAIRFQIQGMKVDDIHKFIHAVSQAKLNRVNQLHHQ